MEFYVGRYIGLDEKTFNIEVVTPMFVSGAETSKAELREPTLKGLLRFWWRATHEFEGVESMKKKEGDLFGNTEKKSKVFIHITPLNVEKDNHELRGESFSIPGHSYQGYILKYLTVGCDNRPYITPGSTYEIKIRFPLLYENEIKQALFAFSMFGGIGSKSRNGFGSFKINNEKQPNITDIFKHETANFTKLNRDSRLFRTEKLFDTWDETLSRIGLIYKEARLSLERTHQFGARSKIALPIVARDAPPEYKKKRQAKPFFLHVTKTKGNKYRGKISFLPTKEMLNTANKTIFNKMLKKIEEKMEVVK